MSVGGRAHWPISSRPTSMAFLNYGKKQPDGLLSVVSVQQLVCASASWNSSSRSHCGEARCWLPSTVRWLLATGKTGRLYRLPGAIRRQAEFARLGRGCCCPPVEVARNDKQRDQPDGHTEPERKEPDQQRRRGRRAPREVEELAAERRDPRLADAQSS